MPLWAIHIALAKKMSKKFNLSDDFVLGNILPDATNGRMVKGLSQSIPHHITHYNFMGPDSPPQNDIVKFQECYRRHLDNPLILGSMMHLLTDNFFNQYTERFHYVNIGNHQAAIMKDQRLDETCTPWLVKQEDFRNYGNQLVRAKKLGSPIHLTSGTVHLAQDLVYTLSKEDLKLIVDRVNGIITNVTCPVEDLKMFTEEELDGLFERCLVHLENTLNQLEDDNIVHHKPTKEKIKRKEESIC